MRWISLLAFVAACETGAEQRRDGQSLLHLEGQLRFEEPSEHARGLVPVLAFATPDGLEIVDVEAQLSFRGDFRIDVHAPPPAAARLDARERPELSAGAELAIAYIAVVPKGHPKTLRYASYIASGMPVSELAACATALPACQRIERWCVDQSERECRLVGLPCGEFESCRPSVSEGDPAIISRPADALAGLSEKFVVMWTRDGLAASSIFSHALGLEDDLMPGYSLVELGEPTDEDGDWSSDPECVTCADGVCLPCDAGDTTDPNACTDPVCEDPILAEALARYNAAHGTDYAGVDEVYDALSGSGAANQAALAAFEDELYLLVDQISIERGIDISELEGTRVRASTQGSEDWETPIVIRISPDVDPLI